MMRITGMRIAVSTRTAPRSREASRNLPLMLSAPRVVRSRPAPAGQLNVSAVTHVSLTPEMRKSRSAVAATHPQLDRSRTEVERLADLALQVPKVRCWQFLADEQREGG